MASKKSSQAQKAVTENKKKTTSASSGSGKARTGKASSTPNVKNKDFDPGLSSNAVVAIVSLCLCPPEKLLPPCFTGSSS